MYLPKGIDDPDEDASKEGKVVPKLPAGDPTGSSYPAEVVPKGSSRPNGDPKGSSSRSVADPKGSSSKASDAKVDSRSRGAVGRTVGDNKLDIMRAQTDAHEENKLSSMRDSSVRIPVPIPREGAILDERAGTMDAEGPESRCGTENAYGG